ncbi:hypothetical protein TNIN_100151 [Trichonephila inaurata madagascariensis]|uniref:Uncharacterized protein n=1 Tax=Trichonephila inaurata madagascariensis TaxID=2747483 RepID=A0A8X7C6Y5_9ARAC|nr:hypothetical protein TNIN_100151 [Trichonephila inaurata madagascariensis]
MFFIPSFPGAFLLDSWRMIFMTSCGEVSGAVWRLELRLRKLLTFLRCDQQSQRRLVRVLLERGSLASQQTSQLCPQYYKVSPWGQ